MDSARNLGIDYGPKQPGHGEVRRKRKREADAKTRRIHRCGFQGDLKAELVKDGVDPMKAYGAAVFGVSNAEIDKAHSRSHAA